MVVGSRNVRHRMNDRIPTLSSRTLWCHDVVEVPGGDRLVLADVRKSKVSSLGGYLRDELLKTRGHGVL